MYDVVLYLMLVHFGRKLMQSFEREITEIARTRAGAYSGGKRESTSGEVDPRINEVMEKLCEQTKVGVIIYNNQSGDKKLSISKLPKELRTIFLNISGGRVGFCLYSEEKFVLFLEESPDQILVLGKTKQSQEKKEFELNRAVQLIKLTYEKVGDKYIFKDNTGSVVDHKEIIIHIIKWVVT